MNSTGKFVAQLLETSARGYAGMSASLLLERHPEIGERYQPDGFSNWKSQFQRWLLDLSASVNLGEPKLFESQVRWTRQAFAARAAPVEDLQTALEALRDILRERLPDGSAVQAVTTVEQAVATVFAPNAGEGDRREPHKPPGQPALSYLQTVLEGRPREAIRQLLKAIDDGSSVSDAYLEVLIPAQREVGRLWHDGELSIAEEHAVTATTQRAMAVLCEKAQSSKSNDKTVLLACVAGNIHDIGIRAISDFFEIAGWRAISLGPDVPYDEISKSAEFFNADLVVLAAAMDPHLKEVQRAIEGLRAIEGRALKVIVGGSAFEGAPDLWQRVGADGFASSLQETEPLGARLTAS